MEDDKERFRKLVRDEEEGEEQDPRKVLDEEFEFLRKNWYRYVIVFFLALGMSAIWIAVFLSFMSWIYNG